MKKKRSRIVTDQLLQNIKNRYELVILASRRARALNQGERPLVESDSKDPVTIALEEIMAGKVKRKEDEKDKSESS